MKKLVWLTVHGEQQYEGMSADSSELRVRGTMEATKDGYLLRYEEADETGRVTTATRLALARSHVPDGAVRAAYPLR